MAKLKVGDKAPNFVLKDQDEKTVKLSDFKGKKLLLYFYPKANTPGCINQACSIRDHSDQLDQQGVCRIGISPDPPAKQKKFEEKQNLNFPLLADQEHKIADAYGVWGEKKLYGKTYMGLIRSSFLIDEKGKLAGVWYKVSPKNTVPKLLEALQE